MTSLGHRKSRLGPQPALEQAEVSPAECLEGAEVLAALRFASWCPPAAAAAPAVPASSRASGAQGPSRKASRAVSLEQPLSSDEEASDDEEYRPSKVRVIHTGTSGTPIILPRRSYTWRGASRRQQQPQHPQHLLVEGGAESSAADEAPSAAALQQAPAAAQPTTSAAGRQSRAGEEEGGAAVSSGCVVAAPAAAAKADTKEGDKEWAALTTWLRMNLHNPRTSKKVVMFVGQRDAAGRWAFNLNPALAWADVSQDTKLRLRDLLSETQAAFSRKYPARPPGDWCKKSQRYRAPGASAIFQVPLDQLVLSLHQMYERFEGAAAPGAAATCSGGSLDSSLTAGLALPAGPGPASPTISHCS